MPTIVEAIDILQKLSRIKPDIFPIIIDLMNLPRFSNELNTNIIEHIKQQLQPVLRSLWASGNAEQITDAQIIFEALSNYKENDQDSCWASFFQNPDGSSLLEEKINNLVLN